MAAGVLGTDAALAQGEEKLRVGLIGCGGRGTGAAQNCVDAAPNVEIYALGDVFQDRLNGCRARLEKQRGAKVNLNDDRCFVGLDAYQKVLDSGVDMVILATPPGFRPTHFKAAVEAGKHVFMEKPVAVCPTGVRMIMDAGKIASEKKLGVVAGTQRRHHAGYVETIKRLHDGAIGRIVAAQCYWNQGGLWKRDRRPEWSDVEWQIRNWLYFTWLSGDHIVEQHVHNLDVVNWVLQAHPVRCVSLGGRQARTDPAYGHIYDHFATDFDYPDGVKVLSMCRQIDNCANRVGEYLIGTEGTSDPGRWIDGKTSFRAQGGPNPYVQEHADLINSIRAGQPLNEAQRIAESTLTAIMARMSAYTGKQVTWDQALNSKLNLIHEDLDLKGKLPVPPVAIPGKTELI
ncbi:MAG: Gfo/Idh/MocA family protein [Armatimonadota bacterium]